jgi:AraC-like DNA-binding protein
MARPSKEPPISSPLVPAIVRRAGSLGLDVGALALRFGLPADAATLDEVTVAADLPEELLRAVARAGAGPGVALAVATELFARRLKLAELAVRATGDVRGALRALARWVPLVHEGLQAELEEGEPARWVLRTPRRPRGVGAHVHELALAWALHHVRAGAGPVAPGGVWFAHARPPELGPVHDFFETTDVLFGCEDSGLALARPDLDRPMRLADVHSAQTLAPLVDAELAARPQGSSLAERVAALVAASLPGCTDVEEVARAMHMSARTLQRRLEQEQTRFGEVLDQARLGVARRLLADRSLTMADVAARVGFSDVATFSRAFKRWTGQPPGQWRRA